MAEFFHLNQQDIENPANAEDKVISREQRIFADNVIFAHGDTYKVKTTSTAYRQKLKFFVDVVEYTDPDTQETFKYRCGYYYECEHYESVRLFTSLGFMSFYFVIDKIDNGEFDFYFYISNENVKLYVSSVVFEDSFYNPDTGWLNPNNPDNIIDDLEDDDDPNIPTIPGYQGGGSVLPYIIIDTGPQTDGSYVAHEDSFCKLTYNIVSSGSSPLIRRVDNLFLELKGDYKPIGTTETNSSLGIPFTSTTNGFQFGLKVIATADGFPLPTYTSLNSQTKYGSFQMVWKAIDGYSYYMTAYLNPGINSNATFIYSQFAFWYWGRSKTDAPPV